MSETPEILSKKESTRIYTLFYSFFLIPFMIAIFGAVFFLLFRFITFETDDASALLNQVKIGSASKRWQSAFELSKVFNNPIRFQLIFLLKIKWYPPIIMQSMTIH